VSLQSWLDRLRSKHPFLYRLLWFSVALILAAFFILLVLVGGD
jgi:hypothetical protein